MSKKPAMGRLPLIRALLAAAAAAVVSFSAVLCAVTPKRRSRRRVIWLSVALAFLWAAVPSRPQARPAPDGASEALSEPEDTVERLHEPNDARVPPDAFLFPRETAQAASGDYRIDALLSTYKWSVATVTYSFYEDDVFHGTYYGSETGVREVSEAVKANVRQIMAWYGTLMNITFVEVAEASDSIGMIRVMLSNGPSYAYTYYPGSTSMTSMAGDVHLNPTYDRLGDTNGFQHPPGKHGYQALVHELGHALGLKHPFEDGATLPAAEDNEAHTVMTYTFTGNEAGTPMGYDVMALQYIYGPKAYRTGDGNYLFTTRGTDQYDLGGTLYLNTSNHTRQAIWDSGGLNTLDCTNLPYNSSGYRLDIRDLGWLVANNVYYTNDFDYGTAIANGVAFRDLVNSSSSDTIYANSQPNVFKGYAPNDTLDLSGYLSSEVADTRTGDDRVLGFGSNGSVTVKGWYAGSSLAIVFGAGACTLANPTVTLSPANPGVSAGGAVQYTVGVTNNDTGSCGDSSFILSSSIPSGWTTQIAPSTLSVPQGQTRTAIISKTAPLDATPGTYFVSATGAKGSYAGTGTASVTVQAQLLPDLTITAFTAPSRGVIGGSVPVSLTVSNQGSIGAGAFRVGLYYSTDAVITTSDVFSGWSCNFPSGLAAGNATVCDGSVAVPASLAPSVYYLGAVADDTFTVVESNESNNARTADIGPIDVGTLDCAYAVSTSGLGAPASGGNIALTIRTDAGCPWSIANLPAWLSVSGSTQGTGPSTVSLFAFTNYGGARSASFSVGGVSVPVRQLDAAACGGSPTCVVRSLPHLAFGGQWTTGLSAIGSGTVAGSFSASFYGDAGTSLALPFTGGLGNLSTLTSTVSPGGMRYYEAENPSVGDLSGWALVTADESVAAQATFRRRTPDGHFYEAAVPGSGGYSRFVMPFDVTTFAPSGAQLFTAFAVVNLNPSAAAHFVCTARNQSGVPIPNAVSIPALGPLGHYTAFNFPLLTGQRGTLDCSADTLVSAIGLRSIGGDAISTLPVIPK
jgi:hypothetical protein